MDGATKISTIADKAIAEGQTAVAITDHGVMYGAVEFYKELKKKGVKPSEEIVELFLNAVAGEEI